MVSVAPKQPIFLQSRNDRLPVSVNACMCTKLKVILLFTRCLGLFPLVPCDKSPYHSINGCHFKVSKLCIFISIVMQIAFFPNVVWHLITYIRLPEHSKKFIRKAQLYSTIFLAVDFYIDLLCAIIYANRLSVILKRLSVIPSSLNDMKRYGQNTTRIMFMTLACVLAIIVTWTVATWTYLPFFTMDKYYYETSLAYIVLVLLALFPFMQTFVTMIICLLIASKFEKLAARIEHYLQQMSNILQLNIIKNSTELQEINYQYRVLNECMIETNNCFRCQLLMAMTNNLFLLIYYLYCKLIHTKINIYDEIHSNLFIFLIILRLILLICTGQIVKSKSERPLLVLQTAEVLYFPEYVQQQVRTLLLQWMNKNPVYLAAFNIVHVGPWLVAPVIGSIITYLIVFMQYEQLN